MQTRLWTKICLIALVAVLMAGLSFAQTSNGTIAGVVTDASGAAITNAKITATSKATGEVRNGQTNAVGAYRFESLIPGPYSISVSAPSFATTTLNNVMVVASVVTAANAELKPGSATETITVEAQAETLQTESGDVTHTINNTAVSSLPISNLNAYSLATTLPGVVTVASSVDMTNGTAFSVNGTRPRANNFLIEGQDNNDAGIKGQGLQPANVDAVREVSVLTNSYAAEFGNGGGSVSNLIFKNGTNDLHGALWDKHLNSALDANDHYNNILGAPKTKYRENIWGFDVGGPIKKDKAFFFVSHQWDWYRSSTTMTDVLLPTAAGHDTLVSLLDNATAAQQAQINTMLQAYGNARGLAGTGKTRPIQLGPDPFTGATRPDIEVGPYTRTGVPASSNSGEFIAKGDYLITQNDTLNLRYVRSAGTWPYDTTNYPDQLPGFDAMQYGASHNAGITYTHIFTPSLVNELRVSYGRIGFTFDFRPETYANPLAMGPTVSVGDLASWGAPSGDPQGRFHNTMQYQDALSWQKGNHSFKFGVDMQDVRVRDAIPFNFYGSIGYASAGNVTALANYIDDFGGKSASASITFGSPVIRPEMLAQGYYIQDTWKIKPNFTLTYGLRYENNGTPANTLPYPAIDPSDMGNPDYLRRIEQKADNNNFGPRFGFAYTPHFWKGVFGEDKTVIRGGAGIFYDGIFTNILDNTAATSPNAVAPSTTSMVNGANPRGTPNWVWTSLLPTLSPVQSPYALIEPISANLQSPVTYQWNFNIERELPGNFTLTTGYVGTRGLHLFSNTEANPYTETGDRLYPDRGRIVLRDNEADSIYHALNVNLSRRFSHGLQAQLAYTWSKMIDTGSELWTGGNFSSFPLVQFPYGRGTYDRGLSAFDRRHRIVLSYIYDIPKLKVSSFHENAVYAAVGQILNGWQISGTTAFQSGAPGNVEVGTDINGDGISNDRPSMGNPAAPLTSWAWQYNGQWCEGVEWANTWDPCNPVDPTSVHWLVPESGVGTPVGRNSFTMPWIQTWTFAATKNIKMGERQGLEFRVEMFNPFNHGNTGIPNLTLITGTSWAQSMNNGNGGIGPATFGDLAITSGGYRDIRLQLKYTF
jgi:hypothetical protein